MQDTRPHTFRAPTSVGPPAHDPKKVNAEVVRQSRDSVRPTLNPEKDGIVAVVGVAHTKRSTTLTLLENWIL